MPKETEGPESELPQQAGKRKANKTNPKPEEGNDDEMDKTEKQQRKTANRTLVV